MDRLGTYYGFIYEDGGPIGPMIKWTLNRGSEENSIVSSGTQYHSGYHKTYTITGNTGPLEGGRIRVDLKISYPTLWLDISMMGHFDSEENSLKGTVTMSDGTPGEFVFKRDPDYVRLYPAPSTIDVEARWKFATRAILDRIRQRSWSPSYILKQIEDGKRYMQLAIRDDYYGQELDDDEVDEYNDLLSSLYESDARFYASLINIKLSKVPIQYVDSSLLWSVLTRAIIALSNVVPVTPPSEERESLAWIVTTRQRWTSAQNPNVSIPWLHLGIGRT